MTDIRELLAEQEANPSTGAAGPGLPQGLPMPRNPSLLEMDPDQRLRVTHHREPRYPFPVPNGWFVVEESANLAVGEVKALHYFDRDLVLFRGEDGVASLVDAHCPHLGAHLAVGGKVENNCIRCPFHGWLFEGGSGKCVEIPYGNAERIPPKAKTRSYPVIERNHMVWAWYHATDGEPFYDVPEVPEFSDPEWSDILVRDFEIRVAAQEMAENNVDYSHFQFTHGTDGIPEDEFITEGTYKRASGSDGAFVREGFGLGLGVLRVRDYVTFLSSTTPVDAGRVHVRWVFTAPRSLGDDVVTKAAESFCAGVSQDIPIWENKVFHQHPVLIKAERPILEHRKWSQQFYSEVPDALG